MIGILLTIEIITLGVWTIFDPLVPDLNNVGRTNCSAKNTNIFIGILLVYKLILIFWSCYNAFRNRNFAREFNETKYIAVTIYNWTFIAIIGLPIIFFIGNSPINFFSLSTSIILFGVTITLITLFAPKVYRIWKHFYSKNEETETGPIEFFGGTPTSGSANSQSNNQSVSNILVNSDSSGSKTDVNNSKTDSGNKL